MRQTSVHRHCAKETQVSWPHVQNYQNKNPIKKLNKEKNLVRQDEQQVNVRWQKTNLVNQVWDVWIQANMEHKAHKHSS